MYEILIRLLKQLACIWIGLGAGLMISGAVFAFIAIIGVVPRLAQKTKTAKFIRVYEEALIAGGIFGTLADFFDIRIMLGAPFVVFYSLTVGIFFGCIAVSLAEVLDVFPILTRRARVRKGMFFFIVALACGKLAGSLLYFLVPGYYRP
jgi:stage V sporulation protein AB